MVRQTLGLLGLAVAASCSSSSAHPIGVEAGPRREDAARSEGSTGQDSGTSCSAGRCVVTLASGQNYSYYLAIDSNRVYWTNYGGNEGGQSTVGTVMSVPLGGGTAVTLASRQKGPSGIALHGANVYWINNATVMSVPIGGGSASTLVTDQSDGFMIAVSDASVFWSANDVTATTQAVWKAPLAGGGGDQLATGHGPALLAIDGTSLYWSVSDVEIGDQGGYSAIEKLPLGGVPEDGGATMLWYGASTPQGLATDGVNVYWTEVLNCLTPPDGATAGNCGGVMRVSVNGGQAMALTPNLPQVDNPVAVDATDVFYANNGSIFKVAKAGGTPVMLVQGMGGNPTSMAVDETSVYWAQPNDGATEGSGLIMKVTPK